MPNGPARGDSHPSGRVMGVIKGRVRVCDCDGCGLIPYHLTPAPPCLCPSMRKAREGEMRRQGQQNSSLPFSLPASSNQPFTSPLYVTTTAAIIPIPNRLHCPVITDLETHYCPILDIHTIHWIYPTLSESDSRQCRRVGAKAGTRSRALE